MASLIWQSADSVTELEFRARPGKGEISVAKSVRIHTALERLDIAGQWFGDDEAQELGAVLAQHKSLKVLCLETCIFAERGFRCIVEAFKISTVLEALYVEFCPFFSTNVSCAEIVSDLLASSSSLKDLELCAINIGERGWRVILNALQINTSLENLSLMHTNIGNTSGAAIAGALVANTTLKKLSLAKCNLGAPAWEANALKINSTIEQLIINLNDVGDTGAQSLADALAVNSSLRALYATECHIGAIGWRALANALMINSSLERLGMSDNKIKDAGATAFADVLASTTSLKMLDVKGCGIVVAGIDVHETSDVGRAWGSNLALPLNFDLEFDSRKDSTAVRAEACRVRYFVLRRREQLLPYGMATIPRLGRSTEGSLQGTQGESTTSSNEDRAECTFRFMDDDVSS